MLPLSPGLLGEVPWRSSKRPALTTILMPPTGGVQSGSPLAAKVPNHAAARGVYGSARQSARHQRPQRPPRLPPPDLTYCDTGSRRLSGNVANRQLAGIHSPPEFVIFVVRHLSLSLWHQHRHGVLFPAASAHSRRFAAGAAQQQTTCFTAGSPSGPTTTCFDSVQYSLCFRSVAMLLHLHQKLRPRQQVRFLTAQAVQTT